MLIIYLILGQYQANLCLANDPTCVPCQDRLPSCISVADGVNAFPNRLWKPSYITCYKNRTVLPLDKCQNGYFHPVQQRCSSNVNKGTYVCFICRIYLVLCYEVSMFNEVPMFVEVSWVSTSTNRLTVLHWVVILQ